MRIEAYNQIQQVYGTNKAGNNTKTNKKTFSDAIEISSMGKEIQAAKQAVASAPDIREELITPLKASIQAGTYTVSAQSFAEKLLSKYEEGTLSI